MNVTQWRGSLLLSDAGVARSVGSCVHYAHCIGKPACAFHLQSECDTLLFFSFQASRCQNYCWPVLWDRGQEGLLWGNKFSCSFVTDLADMNLKYQRHMNKVLNARVLFNFFILGFTAEVLCPLKQSNSSLIVVFFFLTVCFAMNFPPNVYFVALVSYSSFGFFFTKILFWQVKILLRFIFCFIQQWPCCLKMNQCHVTSVLCDWGWRSWKALSLIFWN